MKPMDFLTLVAKLRTAQKTYFKTRSTVDLSIAKQLEREVDTMIEKILAGKNRQPSLFDKNEE